MLSLLAFLQVPRRVVARLNFRIVFMPRHHAEKLNSAQAQVRQVSRRQFRWREIPFLFHFPSFRRKFIVDTSSVSFQSRVEWLKKEIKTWKIRYEKWDCARGPPKITERLSNNFRLSGPCNVELKRFTPEKFSALLSAKTRLLDTVRNALLTCIEESRRNGQLWWWVGQMLGHF